MIYLSPDIAIPLAYLVLVAGCWDVRWRRVPNWLTVSGVLVGIVLNIFLRASRPVAFVEGIGTMAVNFPLYALRATGAGDVKLMVVDSRPPSSSTAEKISEISCNARGLNRS